MGLFEHVSTDPLLQFLVQLALTLALTRILGKLFSYCGQPQVVGEILAGVIMGPSVLGRIPGYTNAIWPTKTPLPPSMQPYDSTQTFSVIADVGVILFMFMLGCEMDHHRIKQQWKQSFPIALSAIIFPFAVGAAASLWLEQINIEGQPPTWQPPKYRSFLLFTGASMSFTAFPVLASLLTTMGLLHAPIGVRVLSCAAVDDVMAWCVLALASSFAQSESAMMGLYTAVGAIAFVIAMVFIIRPGLNFIHQQLIKRNALEGNNYYVCFVMILLIMAAFTTQGLGIHCFFGAFVMGLITPKQGGFAEALAGRMELVSAELLLPLFFASSGIKTDIGTLNTWRYWGIVLALVCIACVAKFTPACLVGKLLLKDRDWRFCVAIGMLMNTRGLVELIALNIGLSMGILSPRMFTMMLLMALATTCMTTPSIHLLYRGRKDELLGEQLTPEAAAAAAAAAKHARSSSIVFVYKQNDRVSEAGQGLPTHSCHSASPLSSSGGAVGAQAVKPAPSAAAAAASTAAADSCTGSQTQAAADINGQKSVQGRPRDEVNSNEQGDV